jgi:Glycosyl transferases group 1
MIGRVHIYSVGDEHTTARYFERVLLAQGQDFTYWDCPPDLKSIRANDLFLFVDPVLDWPIGLERLPCMTAAYLIDVHQDLESRLRLSKFFDVIFVVQKDYVAGFEETGRTNVQWLPLACDPAVHSHPHEVREFDLGFVGKLGQPNTWRNDVLSTILPRYRTNNYNTFYPPRAMADVYGNSKIVLNTSINGDVNMRLFEALASGALLITDRIKNGLNELFVEGEHYVGYATIEEAIEKIDYYLVNAEERMRIASAGQGLVLNCHTYRHRWAELEKFCNMDIKRAPAREATKSELRDLYVEIFVSLRKPLRIYSLFSHYGLSVRLLYNFFLATGRWLNARVPLTPNAILSRLRTK